MHRILIIGSGGVGKSTLATKLAAKTGLPLVHLDRLYWKPGWVGRHKADFERRLRKALKAKRWIMDGNFTGSLEMRLKFCDTVIYLDFNRWICLWRAVKRIFRFYGHRRPDLGEGCEEKLVLEFLRWVWTFNTKIRPTILEQLAKRPKRVKLVTLKTPGEVDGFLSRNHRLRP